MRAPRFWDSAPDAPALRARLLAPLGKLTAMVTARRVAKPADYTASIPVICVGNLNAGGTGKTPTVIAVLQMLSDMGITAHVVSRGYGGTATGPVRVVERTHSAAEVGDEPLLMAAFGSVWVAKDRAAGVRAAQPWISKIKVIAPLMAGKVIDEAMQLHGAKGISQDMTLSHMWTHVRTLRFADGPDAVHRRQVARAELRKYTQANV